MNGSLAGKLLIALPTLQDPRFERAVILLCAHNQDHAMGIVINHLMQDISVDELFEQLGMENPPRISLPLLQGGPVGIERGFVLHSEDYDADGATLAVTDGVCLTATEDVLLALAGDDAPEQAVLALGYAGWGPGQLEEELAENVWLVADADKSIVYDKSYDTKWNRALASIGVTADRLHPNAGHA